jgi:hypothetical protein
MEENKSSDLDNSKINEAKFNSNLKRIIPVILFIIILTLGCCILVIQKNNKNLDVKNVQLQQERDSLRQEKDLIKETVLDLEQKNNDYKNKIEELSQYNQSLEEEKGVVTKELNLTCKKSNKTPNCYDSDNGYNPFIRGYVYARDLEKGYVKSEDLCNGDNLVMEAVCDKNGHAYNGDTYRCPNGCKDGVCIKSDPDDNNCNSSLSCFNFKVNSSCEADENCLWIPEKNWLDGHCEPFDEAKNKIINPDVKEGPECTDSDGGINYYEKGKTSGNHEDFCFKDKNWATGVNYDHRGLYEMYCGDQGSGIQTLTKDHSCPNGCENGACVK